MQKNNKQKKIVLMFPGQGSQSVNMGMDFFEKNDRYLEYFEIAGSICGKDILKIIKGEDTENSLDDTRFSQIAIFSLSCAISDYIKSILGAAVFHRLIKCVIGHSLGDFSALYCCGAYDFKDGARLVSYRSKIMSQANQDSEGMMAAILGAEPEAISKILKDYEGKVFIANYNDYGQIVISGYREHVLDAIAGFKEAGFRKIIPLKVNIYSHCPLMKDVSEKLSAFMEEKIKFDTLNMPFYSSTANSFIRKEEIRQTLTNQLINPIRWVESIEYMLEESADIFIETGPGKVLSGLVLRIAKYNNKEICLYNTSGLEDIKNTVLRLEEESFSNETQG